MAKGPEAFRTISEAAEELGVPQHVLRFWETKFSFIRPMKRAGGRRFYRPQDIAVLRGVQTLLHDEGYTIKGVQKLHKEQGLKRLLSGAGAPEADRWADLMEAGPVEPPPELPFAPPADLDRESLQDLDAEARGRLASILADLEAAKARLDRLI